jgi:membrane fusion protein (multidrug efflux system)
MPVHEDQSLSDLRDEIRRLREEQAQLRKELRTNGHSVQDTTVQRPPGERPIDPHPDEPTREEPPPDHKPPQPNPDDRQKKDEKKPEEPKPPAEERARGFFRRHRLALPILLIALVVVGIGAYFLLNYFNSYASTDDAQVDGHLDPIGARIAGTVTAVFVDNDDSVKAGEVVVQLDPRDYDIALEQAQASYNQALRAVTAEYPNVPITQTTTQTTVATTQSDVLAAEAGVAAAQQDYEAREADLRQVEAQNVKAQSDLKRYGLLVGKDEISRQQYDTAVATAASQAAGVEAAKASAAASQKQLEQRRAQLLQAQTRLQEAQTNAPRQIAIRRADISGREAAAAAAKAQLAQARLNLAYTKIITPVDGVVVSKTAEVGARLAPGEQVMSISEIVDVWVTANFKETELGRMRPGQSVDIHVDALNRDYKGYVAEMPGATGERTSLLPPENATGNFVKVVQRLPVRINLRQGENSDHRLRLGMSVEAKVWL